MQPSINIYHKFKHKLLWHKFLTFLMAGVRVTKVGNSFSAMNMVEKTSFCECYASFIYWKFIFPVIRGIFVWVHSFQLLLPGYISKIDSANHSWHHKITIFFLFALQGLPTTQHKCELFSLTPPNIHTTYNSVLQSWL